MNLPGGTRLGPYEIVSAIGAGGMGQVYKARDTRLGRDVAIKVLAEALASDSEFSERFEREAKTISALDHPNICTLHDVGQERRPDGSDLRYLVMQYLDGETLASRLEKGPIPVEQALKIGIEICAALDRAHRQGVTHRDLKPANVMLARTAAAKTGTAPTRSGTSQTKLLDFGLAKTSAAVLAGGAATVLATPTQGATPLTSQGTILGTFEYMSPEQVEGQEADSRSDIWALGCVLSEMVTGERPFGGKTRASLIGAILKDPPPRVSARQPLAPPGLDHVIATCLAKEPDDRWQSAADIARELTWISATLNDAAPVAAAPTAGRARNRAMWAIATALIAVVTGLAGWFLKPAAATSDRVVVRSILPLGATEAIQLDPMPALAISRDGRQVAYRGSNPRRIYVRALNDSRATAVAGTDGGTYPFFSPNGQSLGFFRDRTIWKVALGGGAPTPIIEIEVTSLRGATWGDDDYIYYTPTYSSGIWRVPSTGGATEQLTIPDFAKGEKTHRFPFVLPGSQAVLFVVGTSRITLFDDARIEAFSLSTRQRSVIVEGGTYPQYVPSGIATGHVLYVREGKMIAIPFDPSALKTIGTPFTAVNDGMFRDPSAGVGNYAVSDNGVFVRVPGGWSSLEQSLEILDRRGTPQPVTAPPGRYNNGSVSSGGNLFVVFKSGATSQIGVVDLARGNWSPLTNEWDNEEPVWVPGGRQIVFLSNRLDGKRNLYIMRADGAGQSERILASDAELMPWSFSSDGTTLAFTSSIGQNTDIWTMTMADRKAQPFLATPDNETAPAISPDDKFIAYQLLRSGRWDVYVQELAPGGRRIVVSDAGGTGPLWIGGRELVYRTGPAVMSVTLTTTPELRAERPVSLFNTTSLLLDVMPGQKLLMRTPALQPPVTALDIVVNWFQELRR